MGYQLEQIKDFYAELKAEVIAVKRIKKEKLLHYVKGNEYNATFFLQHAMLRYIQEKEETKEQRSDDLQRYKKNVSEQINKRLGKQYQEQRTTKARIINEAEEALLNEDDQEIKKIEYELLLKETQNVAQVTNAYKSKVLRLISYLQEGDKIFLDINRKLSEFIQGLKKSRTLH